MSAHRFQTTGRNNWAGINARSDADRRHWHGRIQPMDAPRVSLLRRLFGRGA
jgi:hypothetical protein